MPDNEKPSTRQSSRSTQNSFDFLFLHEWSFVYSVPVEYLVRLKKYVVLHSMTVLPSPQWFFNHWGPLYNLLHLLSKQNSVFVSGSSETYFEIQHSQELTSVMPM